MSLSSLWVDGIQVCDPHQQDILSNRGLQYGDGLFETMLLKSGKIRLRNYHLQRLEAGCQRLGINGLDMQLLCRELDMLPNADEPLIVKLMIIRGGGGRGYRPAPDAGSQRLIWLLPCPAAPTELSIKWCETRLARNPQLAGIKHLNRLEQVLAQRELGTFDDGLLLDTEGYLISATAGNLFTVVDGQLFTPDLHACGIRGVMRRFVMEVAVDHGLTVTECGIRPENIEAAQELFITNALRGVRGVSNLAGRKLSVGPVSRRLADTIGAFVAV